MKTLSTAAARLFGFTVWGHGHTKQHHTLSLADALQWAACYERATITRRGRFYSLKTTGA